MLCVNSTERMVDQLGDWMSTSAGGIQQVSDRSYPKVTFLGTVSGYPARFRNNSSVLVETRPDNYIMFDCGEGTLLQVPNIFAT